MKAANEPCYRPREEPLPKEDGFMIVASCLACAAFWALFLIAWL